MMRRFALILTIIVGVALCGCAKTADSGEADVSMPETGISEFRKNVASYNEMPESQEIPNSGDGTSAMQEQNPSENEEYTDIAQGGPYGKISISLPSGWDYELCPIDSDKLLSTMYGIHFYPEAAAEGYIELAYEDSFGVCGTGLKEEAATIAGNPANIGTYDNNEYWDFISFSGDCEGIYALTYFVDGWWSEYGAGVMDILETLSFDPDDKEGGVYVYDEESEADRIGLSFYLKNISPTGATLVFDQYDDKAPTGDLEYGQEFSLEQLKDGKWEETPVTIEGEYGFNALAYIIEAGERKEEKLSWEWLYGELGAGEYRIKKRIMDFRDSGDYDVYTLYARFILN